jgi:hypothetical protein
MKQHDYKPELGERLEAHCHKDSFAVTEKSDKKRARSCARNGGETAILVACD